MTDTTLIIRPPTFDEWVQAKRADVAHRGDDGYPMAALIQIDGFTDCHPGDSVMPGDDDGDQLMGGASYEPQRSPVTVRVHIAAGTDAQTAVRLLRKAIGWIERDPALLEYMDPRTPPGPPPF